MEKLIIKEATKDDLKGIIALVKELAEYENLLHSVVCDEKAYEEALFKHSYGKALVLEYEKQMIGYVLYFYTFSSFLGSGGMWLEDLYIRKEFRKRGFGKAVFKHLAQLCKDKNLKRLEWLCLHENELGKNFYSKLNALDMNEKWIMYRLENKNLLNLSQSENEQDKKSPLS